MKQIGMNELRSQFLEFFKEKNHTIIDSFPLVPQDDPSLLLINAGMAPLKPYFTGDAKMPGNRAASSQRCIRTDDLENVGKTDRHGTFFEMLGNFSFGDYFKKEAIAWSWEFMTEVLDLDKDKIWVTIYLDDDEAHDIWRDEIGIAEEKIVRLGKEDNFWELEVGPSGPCTEIHIDRGEKYGCGSPDCKPGCDCDRYMEVWNLVFSQYIKDENGVYHDAPRPNIDTGMGLERIALIMEGVDNIFEVSLIKNIISGIEGLSGKKYKENKEDDISFRIISDHARSFTFLALDGVVPSNEGRGYVLRRLIRRAIRHGILLGIEGDFIKDLAGFVMDSYKESYPELIDHKDRIFKVLETEEAQFNKTINQGLDRLETLMEEDKEKGIKEISGEEAFKLYDTFGFPLDLTMEIASEKGFTVDEKAFNEEMENQKERSRASREVDDGFHSQGLIETSAPATIFTGYDTFSDQAKVLELYVQGQRVDSVSSEQEAIMITDKTPFYAEGGGQIGDRGSLSSLDALGFVNTTHKNADDVFFHYIDITEGTIKEGQSIVLEVDKLTRRAAMKNHSATHLLNQVLRDVLGNHVGQMGSYVSDHRLRFDFSHYEAISDEDLKTIERMVNELIEENLEVCKEEMKLAEANEIGAIGAFEDKYKDIVRVVKMGDYSMELCGGTHVNRTSEVQMFKILSESGISAGVRRIEAITGLEVYEYILGLNEERKTLARNLNSGVQNLISRSVSLIQEMKDQDKKIKNLEKTMRESSLDDLLETSEEINGIKLLTHKYDNMDMDSLRKLADQFRDNLQNAVVVLANVKDDKLTFVATVSQNLIDKGLNSGNIVRETAQITGGNGGGRPDFATAGGKDISKLNEALENVKEIIKRV